MILDGQNLFSEDQVVTATAASTNLIDLNAAGDLGNGTNLYIDVVVVSALVGSGATLAVTVETDDNAAFASAAVVQTIGTFSALAAAGTRLVARIQPEAVTERYVRLKFTVAGGTMTDSGVTAFIAHGIDATAHYADAITIS